VEPWPEHFNFKQILSKRAHCRLCGGTISVAVIWFDDTAMDADQVESIMNGRITDKGEAIDRKTCRSICDAVGERLQRNLRPESLRLSSYLELLMDELRRQDDEGGQRSSN
jgi:hypothetical protein